RRGLWGGGGRRRGPPLECAINGWRVGSTGSGQAIAASVYGASGVEPPHVVPYGQKGARISPCGRWGRLHVGHIAWVLPGREEDGSSFNPSRWVLPRRWPTGSLRVGEVPVGDVPVVVGERRELDVLVAELARHAARGADEDQRDDDVIQDDLVVHRDEEI